MITGQLPRTNSIQAALGGFAAPRPPSRPGRAAHRPAGILTARRRRNARLRMPADRIAASGRTIPIGAYNGSKENFCPLTDNSPIRPPTEWMNTAMPL